MRFFLILIFFSMVFFQQLVSPSFYKNKNIQSIKESMSYMEMIDYFISREVSKYNNEKLTADLVHAVIMTESDYFWFAISHKYCIGLMQISAACLSDYNSKKNEDIGFHELFEEEINIKVGVWYLDFCLRKKGNVHDALLAYYWGPWNDETTNRYANAVIKKLKYFKNGGKMELDDPRRKKLRNRFSKERGISPVISLSKEYVTHNPRGYLAAYTHSLEGQAIELAEEVERLKKTIKSLEGERKAVNINASDIFSKK